MTGAELGRALAGLPPAAPLLLGAVVAPLLPLKPRRWLTLLAPLWALACVTSLPLGGGWRAGFLGYPLVVVRNDALSHVFGLVFAAVAFLGNLYGWHRSDRTEPAMGLLYAGAGLGVVYAGDLLTFLVFWEVMAVASAFLIFLGPGPAAVRAGQRYLLVHATAGGLLLLGVLMVLRQGGPIEFAAFEPGPAFWFVLIALCVNAAVPPLHAWLPDAYPEASVAGSVLLSAFTTKAAVYSLLRGFPGTELLVWAGAVMAVYGVVFAVMENNLRRLLGYHIVSQVGYMVCGAGIGTPLGVDGSAAHAFCHILYKALLYMGVGAVAYRAGREKLTELGGLWPSMPLTFGCYMVGALSIAGMPLFNGFISKSVVVAAAEEAGLGAAISRLSS